MKQKPKRTNDRVTIPGGAPCPRCADTLMQRYQRPPNYVPSNSTPFLAVQVWDRCSCGWITRLEPAQ